MLDNLQYETIDILKLPFSYFWCSLWAQVDMIPCCCWMAWQVCFSNTFGFLQFCHRSSEKIENTNLLLHVICSLQIVGTNCKTQNCSCFRTSFSRGVRNSFLQISGDLQEKAGKELKIPHCGCTSAHWKPHSVSVTHLGRLRDIPFPHTYMEKTAPVQLLL